VAWHDMAGERHGSGMGAAWARHAMCESAFRVSSPQPHAQNERQVDIIGTVNILYISLNNA